MLTVIKKNSTDLKSWLATEWGFISGLAQYDGEPIVLEPYQIEFMCNPSRFRWVTKARQVGYSFVFALEALARCHLRDGHTAFFVSYNLEDAKEKIFIARQVYEELPTSYKKRLIGESKTELVFQGASNRVSRIVSLPSKPPRGKKGDVYLDELAHIQDRDVYTGSTALILRSAGQLTGASTPLGRRGIFWEIAKEELRAYPHHWRQEVPWWHCKFFCEDVARAKESASKLSTEDLVGRFGKQNIIEQFDSLPLDDFKQEFSAEFVDESYSYYPYSLILPCTKDRITPAREFTDIPQPKGRIVAGFDVGRTRDTSELAVFEDRDGHFIARLFRSYDQVPFAEQEEDLRGLLDMLPVVRLSIDSTGLGMHLAENLSRDYPQVQSEVFTNQNKERWATDLKILLQRHDILLPRDRELVGQIHSIKRRVLPSGKIGFDTEKAGKGHADRFWAVALAVQKERSQGSSKKAKVGVRIVG
jgi:phage FluMu gp28-like protein